MPPRHAVPMAAAFAAVWVSAAWTSPALAQHHEYDPLAGRAAKVFAQGGAYSPLTHLDPGGDVAGDEPRRAVQAASPGAGDYATYCAACHGERGRGDGPLAPLLAGPLQDLTALSLGNDGRFPVERVRRAIDGRRPVKAHGGMPAWGDAFTGPPGNHDRTEEARERINDLTSFLASIQQGAGAEEEVRTESALCVFANPGYAGRCTETAELRGGAGPQEACEAILACLNRASCPKTYCGATTIREGWTLESARRVLVEP